MNKSVCFAWIIEFQGDPFGELSGGQGGGFDDRADRDVTVALEGGDAQVNGCQMWVKEGDGGALLDANNVKCLCGSCHTRKTVAARAKRMAARP